MSSDLASFFPLNDEHPQLIIARQITGSDSSFVTSSFIGHCIKNKQPVFLVLLHNSLMHYHNVGLRMYYNLKSNVENNTVTVYNLAEEITQAITRNESLTLQEIQAKISNQVILIQKEHKKVHVIIDGVTHLLDLNFSLDAVNRFCVDFIRKMRNCNSIALFNCDVAGEDDNSYVLTNLLSHMAHLILQVEALPSGLSADISGHLTVTQIGKLYDKENHDILETKPIRYHFKLFDKGVKLFAPGAV